MRAAVAALDDTTPATASALFNKVGMTLVSTVGGASGPLFGTLFLRIGASLGDTTEVSLPQLANALHAGLDGIVARGKAEAGDKTMYDALAPAVDALETAAANGVDKTDALKLALVAAESGRDATTPMLARKGRASYLGERSVGHQDPGATTIALLMAAATRAPL
jgi:dihydroxyacetone kinase-like protein